MKGISHSILTFERPKMLLDLVAELESERCNSPDPSEIIIVDDGSLSEAQHRALEDLETQGIQVLRKNHGLGMPESWARNVSRGLASSQYDVIFHWDDDTRVRGTPGWSETIAKKLRAHPELGTLCPRRTGIMEPYVKTPYDYLLSFGLTEPCFALRRSTFDQIGPLDESLRWFYGPDYSLRIMEAGYECAFEPVCWQLDLQIRRGMPQDTFPRADGGPYFKKWIEHYGCGEHEWPPFVRHRARVAAAAG